MLTWTRLGWCGAEPRWRLQRQAEVVALEHNAEVVVPERSPRVALVGAQQSRGARRSCVRGRMSGGGGSGSLPRRVKEVTGGERPEPLGSVEVLESVGTAYLRNILILERLLFILFQTTHA
jgi:hypothetical protein